MDLYSSENGYLTSGITDRKRKKKAETILHTDK